MYEEYGPCKIVKTLVVQNEIDEKTSVARVQLQVIDNCVLILEAFKSIRMDISDKIIRIYDFQRNLYNVVHPQTKIPLCWITANGCDLILVKLATEIQSLTSHSGSLSHEAEKLSESSSVKKERSKERVIFQVIEIVKKWRELHLNRNSSKKISLMEAAKAVGMPKKSLDDYYYQLRLGEKYGFDFESHLFERVGVLRTFLKNLKGRANIDKYEKHPKNLKIIDKFAELSQMFYGSKNQAYTSAKPDMQQQAIEQDVLRENEGDQQFDREQMNEFRSEFEYLLDEKDPFLVGDYNFKKKMMQVDQDQIFF